MGDYRTTDGESPPLSRRERKQLRRRVAAIAAIAALVIGLAGMVIRVPRAIPATGHVITEAYAEVRPVTSGVVLDVPVSSGDEVDAGAVLCRLDDTEERASLEEARSRVHQARAQLVQREAEIEVAKRDLASDVELARLRVKHTEAMLAQQRDLITKGLAPATTEADVDFAAQLNRAKLETLEAKDGSVLAKELDVLRDELAARQQRVERLQARLRTRTILSPIDGRVQRRDFTRGELVRPDQVLFEVFGGDLCVLKLKVPERNALRVASGQRYRARLGSLRGLGDDEFEGTVRSLRDLIESDGSSLYRVVYCGFDCGGLPIPPGTSAEARIRYGTSSLWRYVFGLD